MQEKEIKELINKVNSYLMSEYPESGDCSWERSCYILGIIDAYKATGERKYIDYALKWAEDNSWSFYSGEPQGCPTYKNADYQFCGEIYTKLIEHLHLDDSKKEYIKEVEIPLNDKEVDYWWWVDTIYMALPFYNIMGKKYKDDRFFEKVHALYKDVRDRRQCYDTNEHLWYRDERFLPGNELAPDGEKIFWSRGNGWVIGGIVRTLEVLDETDKYYNEYKEDFLNMAKRLLPLMQSDGFWRVNLLNPQQYDCMETSGTVLYTMSFLKGYNLGLLDKKYYDAAIKAFSAICTNAIDEDGKICWAQDVAWGPTPIKKETTKEYVVGCFTICCNEILKAMKNI